MKKQFRQILTLLCISAVTNPVWAGLSSADFNYNNDIIGDRATGMGGAFTAISDDPSGAFYNPAGLSFALDNQISLSVNTYKTKSVEYDKAIGGNTTYKQNLESFYPSMFGVVQTFGPFKVAFTFMNVNNEILDQDQHFKGVNIPQVGVEDTNSDSIADSAVAGVSVNTNSDFIINYNNTDNTLFTGLSMSAFITDSWTIGITGHFMRRRQEQISNQWVIINSATDSAATNIDENAYYGDRYSHTVNHQTDEVLGIMPRLGTQIMPTKTMSVGVSVGKGFILDHQRTIQTSVNGGTSSFSNVAFTESEKELTDSEMPLNARGGFAWFPSTKFVISADVIADIGNKNFASDANTTLNYALGTEYFVTNALPIRAGIFTNFANTNAVEDGNDNRDLNVDLYGISLSVSWQSRNSSVTIGGFYQSNFFGDGKTRIIGGSNAIQNVSVSMLQLGLTGSAKY